MSDTNKLVTIDRDVLLNLVEFVHTIRIPTICSEAGCGFSEEDILSKMDLADREWERILRVADKALGGDGGWLKNFDDDDDDENKEISGAQYQ